jgi:hypothetical protein
MTKVDFTYKDGRTRSIPEAHAKILGKLKRGTYQTLDMVAAPVQQVMQAAAPAPAPAQQVSAPETVIHTPSGSYRLNGLDAEDLHELAAGLGVKVHARAGVAKVTAALQEAFPS